MRTLLLILAIATLGVARAAHAHPGSGIVVDRSGRIFFVVLGSNVIMVREPNGTVRTFAQDERLRAPHHLVLGRDGSLYVASDYDGRVWRVEANGTLTEYFNSNRIADSLGVQVGSWGDPFTIDPAGNIYALASPNGSRIIRISPDARVTPIATRARFGPLHFRTMAWGPDGALYLTDAIQVWRIVGDSATRIVARGRSLLDAAGVAVDSAGNIYVADYAGRRVVRLGRDGAVNTLPALERLRVRNPIGVTLAANGDVYVLDSPPRGIAIWRIRGDDVARLYQHRDLQVYLVRALLVLLPLLLAIQIWRRTRRRGAPSTS